MRVYACVYVYVVLVVLEKLAEATHCVMCIHAMSPMYMSAGWIGRWTVYMHMHACHQAARGRVQGRVQGRLCFWLAPSHLLAR